MTERSQNPVGAAALELFAQSHQAIRDAQTALVALFAIGSASFLAQITVVATLAAGGLGHSPEGWWWSTAVLIGSIVVSTPGVRRIPHQSPNLGVLLNAALTDSIEEKNDPWWLDLALASATQNNTQTAKELHKNIRYSLFLLAGALLLTAIPIYFHWHQVFRL